MGKIYQNDVKVELRVAVTADLTGATVTRLKVKKPSGVEVTWNASLHDSTTMTYTTVLADLNEVGEYVIQSYAEWANGSKHTGEPARLDVYAPYQ